MEKRLEDLSDNELKAIKAIINGYPMTSEMMKIKKDLNNESGSIYKNVYILLKIENDKKKALEKFKKEEMKRYRSFDERKINILHKSLSLKRKIPNLQKLNKSMKSIKNNPTKPTSINYINDDKYKLYDDNYKKVISARSKSLTVSKSISSAINLEEEDIIDNLKSYMDKYFYPGNIIRYLSMLDKRFCDFNETCDYGRFKKEDDYKCGSIHNNIFLYNFLQIIDVKCLYICFHNGKHYISPLNDKVFLSFIQTKSNLPYDNMLDNPEINKKYYDTILSSLNKTFEKFKKIFYNSETHKLEIPCQLYDLVIKHNMFNYDIEINAMLEVKLLGINNKNFISSIINNNSHSISVIKLNDKKYFNPAYENGITEKYRMYEYTPLFNQNYYLKKDSFSNTEHELNKINIKDIEKIEDIKGVRELYNSRFMYSLNKSIYAYTGDNLHLFSNRHPLRKLKKYKVVNGGSSLKNNISLYIPSNRNGFCWYLSIISSIFYADEISTIMLNKSIRYIKRSIDLLIKYAAELETVRNETLINYNRFNKDKTNIINMLIYINIFVYTSYALIVKNKFHEITDKKNWILCLNSLFENEKIINYWNNYLLKFTLIEWQKIK